MHIIGSAPTEVSLGTDANWGLIRYNLEYNAKMKLHLTLDEDGVTPLTFNDGPWDVPSRGLTPTITGFITVDVDEIATYLAGTGNVGDTIDVARNSHTEGIAHKDRWTTGLVDGGAGSLAFSDDGKALVLTILPEPATMALLGLGGLGVLLRRKRR